jgi:hypothetical protein
MILCFPFDDKADQPVDFTNHIKTLIKPMLG